MRREANRAAGACDLVVEPLPCMLEALGSNLALEKILKHNNQWELIRD